jgi:choline-glycine betaine transporter
VGVLAAVLGLFSYAPNVKRFRPHHWWSAALLLLLVPLFFAMMIHSSRYAQKKLGPWFDQLEARQPK